MHNAIILLRPIFAAALMAVSSVTSFAQTPPSAPENAKPEAAPAPPEGKSPNEPLSKKLDDNEGVLKPPEGVDPKMNKGAPAKSGDKMPVIIPPGEPGGDQSVQPK